jgi:glycosyltransferase involved in cell wall biosynthesis
MVQPHPMKPILLLVDSLGLSGKTKSLVDLAIHMDRTRFVPIVASLAETDSLLADRLRAAGIRTELLGIPSGIGPETLIRLRRFVGSVGPHLLHCFNPRPILLGGLVGRLTGCPVIGSLSAFACQVPDREYAYLPQPLVTVNRRQVYRNRIACSFVEFLVAVSDELGTRFFRYNGLPIRKLRTVAYGIDVDTFQRYTEADTTAFRATHGIPPKAFLIGSVGRLVEEKDYPTQFKAFAIAARRCSSLHMLLAGDGPLRSRLEDLAVSLGIADRVTFLGHSDSIPLVMRSLDVFVLASKFETFGVALIEAKAAGIAIVATNIHEIPEILSEGSAGRLVPSQAPEAMATAFIELATDPIARRSLAGRALTEARERHSLEAMVRGYQQLYVEAAK